MAPYEAFYKRKCRSFVYWDEVGERKLVEPKILQQTQNVVAKIRERIKTSQDRQKSYTDSRRKELEFTVGDKGFLKIAPMNGIMSFVKKRKTESMVLQTV